MIDIDPLKVLGRTPVAISLKESLSYLRGKRVLITGAGGSIGSELSRQLLHGGAERLYLFGHGENSIYLIDRELRTLQNEGVGETAAIVPVIGDMKNRDYMFYILEKLRCDVIFHCAAYKHVPLMEENPVAVIENNVFGTKNVLDAALANNVRRFVLISTDKAVNPVSVYGTSKMLCEKLVLDTAAKIAPVGTNHAYMFVRFGNVLGSRGSVLPLFMHQIQHGGPVTVTHRDMKRYFMTIPEACSLVLQTGGVGKNGIPYMLDMGEPVRIYDLAEQVIRLSGYEPGSDIQIAVTGLRKGERLDEPLWLPEENPQPTQYPKIMQLQNNRLHGVSLANLLKNFEPVCFLQEEQEALYRNKEALIDALCESIPSYKEVC
jgi:FlaA1/EpsC-like NDP-sugar epimerase